MKQQLCIEVFTGWVCVGNCWASVDSLEQLSALLVEKHWTIERNQHRTTSKREFLHSDYDLVKTLRKMECIYFIIGFELFSLLGNVIFYVLFIISFVHIFQVNESLVLFVTTGPVQQYFFV